MHKGFCFFSTFHLLRRPHADRSHGNVTTDKSADAQGHEYEAVLSHTGEMLQSPHRLSGYLVLRSPELAWPHQCQQKGRITALDLLATLLLMQPRLLLAFTARTHCWLTNMDFSTEETVEEHTPANRVTWHEDFSRAKARSPAESQAHSKFFASDHHIYTAFKYPQGWGLHHSPGQPVPMLDNPFSEDIFPNIQPKPPLAVVESDEVSPQPPFLQAEQPQVPQPLPISLVLQTLPQLRCPSLDTLQPLNVSLGVGGPTLNTAFEVRPHQCRVQGHDHCPSPAGHAISDTSQDAVGLLGHLGTLLATQAPSRYRTAAAGARWASRPVMEDIRREQKAALLRQQLPFYAPARKLKDRGLQISGCSYQRFLSSTGCNASHALLLPVLTAAKAGNVQGEAEGTGSVQLKERRLRGNLIAVCNYLMGSYRSVRQTLLRAAQRKDKRKQKKVTAKAVSAADKEKFFNECGQSGTGCLGRLYNLQLWTYFRTKGEKVLGCLTSHQHEQGVAPGVLRRHLSTKIILQSHDRSASHTPATTWEVPGHAEALFLAKVPCNGVTATAFPRMATEKSEGTARPAQAGIERNSPAQQEVGKGTLSPSARRGGRQEGSIRRSGNLSIRPYLDA
ncbi:hypothetical protein QYF61_027907 [Mycteria americana]|uniref:Uncharacterized protein n=1 Tax=Mycteria americana TaxID=33587 RepID=A0AAN7S1C6_MYCAM|nr:hypothetical protein QYF61_027907 [Mycteria americana]